MTIDHTAAEDAFDALLHEASLLGPLERYAEADRLNVLALTLVGAASELRTQAVADLVEHAGREEAARQLGLTVRAVRRHAPSGQVQRAKTLDGRKAQSVRLYEQGVPISIIARRLRMDHRTIRTAILDAGVTLREVHLRKPHQPVPVGDEAFEPAPCEEET